MTGSSIYWSANEGSVGRAAINGTGKSVDFISAPALPCGVAVDSGHVYWADIDNFGAPSYIGRAGLDGNNVEDHFVTIPGTSFPCGVAVNAANIYWTEPGFFPKAPGSGGPTSTAAAGSQFHRRSNEPCGIAVFGLQLFWANSESNAIGRANTDSTGLNNPSSQPAAIRSAGSPSMPCSRRRHRPNRRGAPQTPLRRRGRQDVTPPDDDDRHRPRQEARPGQGEVLLRVERGRLDLHLQVRRQEAGGLHIAEALFRPGARQARPQSGRPTGRGTKNRRRRSGASGFRLRPDPRSTRRLQVEVERLRVEALGTGGVGSGEVAPSYSILPSKWVGRVNFPFRVQSATWVPGPDAGPRVHPEQNALAPTRFPSSVPFEGLRPLLTYWSA